MEHWSNDMITASLRNNVLAVCLSLLALPVAIAQSGEGRPRNMPPGETVAGKVESLTKDSLVITPLAGGDPVTIKIGENTRLMKERQPVKLDAIKSGDAVFARGELNGKVMDARVVGVISPEMMQRLQQGGGAAMFGGSPGAFNREDLGKKFIAGEVKAMNETKLTIARPDGQSQDIEVDENTSFKKGQESITLPDIKVGDFVRGRGELKDGTFVPKELIVGRPQMRAFGGSRSNGSSAANNEAEKPNTPQSPAKDAPPKN